MTSPDQILPLGRLLLQQATPPAPTPTVVERPEWQHREEKYRCVRGKAMGRLLTACRTPNGLFRMLVCAAD